MEESKHHTEQAGVSAALFSTLSTFSTTSRNLLEGDADALKLTRRALELEHELQAIRERKNTVMAINRLAPEILAKIFTILALDEADDGTAQSSKLLWLKVTYVCRHWRLVALDYAPLWPRLRCSVHPEITKLMLARSKKALLDIAIEGTRKIGPVLEGTLCEALSQVDRLQAVVLDNSQEHDLKLDILLTHIGKGFAPNLRKLSIQSSRYSPHSLSVGFLLGGAPALEQLRFSRVVVAWNALPLPAGLTELSLQRAATRPLPEQFFSSLKKLPLLKKLHLVNYLPDGSTCYDVPPIRLPALRTIQIEDACATVNQFLQTVENLKLTCVSATLTDNSIPTAILDSCFANVRTAVFEVVRKLPGISHFFVRHFDGHRIEPGTFNILWHPVSTANQTEALALEVDFIFRSSSAIVFGQAYRSLDTHFDLTSTSQLTLEASCCMDPSAVTFKNAMVKLPNVERLSIVSGYLPTIVTSINADPALLRTKKAGRGPRSSIPYFPSLSSIILQDVDLDQDIGILINLITKRPEKYQINNLELYECRKFNQFAYNQLVRKLHLIDVEWDGKVVEDEDEDFIW